MSQILSFPSSGGYGIWGYKMMNFTHEWKILKSLILTEISVEEPITLVIKT